MARPRPASQAKPAPSAQPNDLLRLFIAIELDDAAIDALSIVQEELKPRVPRGSVRWVDPDGIHLTLKFLGETPAARRPEIEAALAEACRPLAPFAFTLAGRGCFPNFRRPNVIWVAALDRGNVLARLHEAIEAAIAPLGWPTEGRAFQPHLTLGRVRRGLAPRDLAAVGNAVETLEVEQIATVTVEEISLMRSELRPGGSVYTRLFAAKLEGA